MSSKNGYSLAEVLTHPLYSTDTAPLNVHLFQSLQDSLMEKIQFPGKASVKHLEQIFSQKDKKFWEEGIMKLPEKWKKAAEQSSLHCSVKFLVKMKNGSFIFT